MKKFTLFAIFICFPLVCFGQATWLSRVLLYDPLVAQDEFGSWALESVRQAVTHAQKTEKPASEQRRLQWDQGILAYRLGNMDEAMTALNEAWIAYNLRIACVAHALASLTARAQWQTTQAQEIFAQAEQAYQELMQGNQDDWGPRWHELVLVELVMQEAHRAAGKEEK